LSEIREVISTATVSLTFSTTARTQRTPNQTDTDSDGIGDACNDAEDSDGDEWGDVSDNCPDDPNLDQQDSDSDGIGDVCDSFPNDPDNDKAQCFVDLAQAGADLATCQAQQVFQDTDSDGEEDSTDFCPDTEFSASVDGNGCSLEQFCGSIDASTKTGERICKSSDWQNDEALGNAGGCAIQKQGRGQPSLCVANLP
jgi:hypothetical protein